MITYQPSNGGSAMDSPGRCENCGQWIEQANHECDVWQRAAYQMERFGEAVRSLAVDVLAETRERSRRDVQQKRKQLRKGK